MTHQTHHQGHPYVRLTFTPAGSSRQRTVWAIQEGPNTFRRAADDGGPWQRKKGNTVTEEVIIALPHERTTDPAGVSLHYCRMEVLPY